MTSPLLQCSVTTQSKGTAVSPDQRLCPFSEFVGRDRPRQLALNASTTEYQLKNVAHDTEYVLTLYVLFGPVAGPGVSATFRTCEHYVSVFTRRAAAGWRRDCSSFVSKLQDIVQIKVSRCITCDPKKSSPVNVLKR